MRPNLKKEKGSAISDRLNRKKTGKNHRAWGDNSDSGDDIKHSCAVQNQKKKKKKKKSKRHRKSQPGSGNDPGKV